MAGDKDKYIEQQLNALLEGIGEGHIHTQELKEQISNLRSEYEAAREKAAKKPKEKEPFELLQTALAGSLPGITKGTLSAVTAFQQQPPDAISGSAAIMDICSSLATALGGLSTAGGPPGAVLGALFSMVSLILQFFAPKPPSLVSQIEKLLRDIGAEIKNSEIQAAAEAVQLYAEACDKFMKPTNKGGVRDPAGLTKVLKKFNLVEGNTITTIRTVRNWLLTEGNQDLDGWPEILNLQCETYMHLMLAVTRQNLYAHDKQKIKKYTGHPKPDRKKKKRWAKLQSEVKVNDANLSINNTFTAKFLKNVIPVARKRGLFVIRAGSGSTYVGTGPRGFRENTFGNSIFDNCRRISLTAPQSPASSPPQYDLWVLDSGSGGYAYHIGLNSRMRTRTKPLADYVGGEKAVGWPFLDWWVAPQSGNKFRVYTLNRVPGHGLDPFKKPWEPGGDLDGYNWDMAHKKTFNRFLHNPTGLRLLQVRVPKPVAVLADDPDRDAMPKRFLDGADVVYGTLDKSKDVYVWVDKQETVPIPMSTYTGIAVDPYFLWVCGDHGIVCTTHASVQSCIQKKCSMPRWLGPATNNIRRVIDMSSCEDGTLLVTTPERLATAVYHVDFTTPSLGNGQRLIVEEWENLAAGANSPQVQKLPIFGWAMIVRLAAAVAQPAAFRQGA